MIDTRPIQLVCVLWSPLALLSSQRNPLGLVQWCHRRGYLCTREWRPCERRSRCKRRFNTSCSLQLGPSRANCSSRPS
ncbi:hypothetical protein BGY98DRAFT_993614 [Russula aff. rugulosa BPL654]|nr:hypothetical protein BGY98DRAFT_993614 [Russula aff. rugulosa BPL654]